MGDSGIEGKRGGRVSTVGQIFQSLPCILFQLLYKSYLHIAELPKWGYLLVYGIDYYYSEFK